MIHRTKAFLDHFEKSQNMASERRKDKRTFIVSVIAAVTGIAAVVVASLHLYFSYVNPTQSNVGEEPTHAEERQKLKPGE